MDFRVGDYVYHDFFKLGKVKEVNNDGSLIIDFHDRNDLNHRMSKGIAEKSLRVLDKNHFYVLKKTIQKKELAPMFFQDDSMIKVLHKSFGEKTRISSLKDEIVPSVLTPIEWKSFIYQVERYESGKNTSMVFKYNYCDGGSSDSRIGFSGPCSDCLIHKNIEEIGRSWCKNPNSKCSKYLKNMMSRSELEKEWNDTFLCYESALLKDWKAGIGVDEKTGRPRNIGKNWNVMNGLAVMTSVFERGQEDSRFIFAVFIIKKPFYGDSRDEGYVSAGEENERSVIELSKQEAMQMPFWKYYNNSDDSVVWNSKLYRFIPNEDAVRILKDIIAIKEDPDEKQNAEKVLIEFCKLNGITQ